MHYYHIDRSNCNKYQYIERNFIKSKISSLYLLSDTYLQSHLPSNRNKLSTDFSSHTPRRASPMHRLHRSQFTHTPLTENHEPSNTLIRTGPVSVYPTVSLRGALIKRPATRNIIHRNAPKLAQWPNFGLRPPLAAGEPASRVESFVPRMQTTDACIDASVAK